MDILNITFWVLQFALAWFCIAGGFFQIFKFNDLKKGVNATRALPRVLWTLLGLIGIVAGLALVLPALTGILPIITVYAALTMVAHSLVITALYLVYKDRSPVIFTIVMAVLAAIIAYGRFFLSPL